MGESREKVPANQLVFQVSDTQIEDLSLTDDEHSAHHGY
jgi:hypothetical protein